LQDGWTGRNTDDVGRDLSRRVLAFVAGQAVRMDPFARLHFGGLAAAPSVDAPFASTFPT